MPDPKYIWAAAFTCTVAVAMVIRTRAKRAVEGRTLARLPLDSAGVIHGAGPIDLDTGGPAVPGALLLHGFGDTPQTLAYLASALHKRGWDVRVPLLPGHGRSLPAWSRSRGTDWLEAARRELARMRDAHDTVAIVGLSMGGSLATILAADAAANASTSRVAALVLIAPYFRLPRWVSVIARWHAVAGPLAPYVSAGGGPSILDPSEQARSLAYGVTTPRLVYELGALARRAWSVLPEVMVPTMILQSHRDNRTTAEIAEAAVARLGAPDKRLTWIDDGAHVITVDYGRELVAAQTSEWLDAHAPTASRSRLVRGA